MPWLLDAVVCVVLDLFVSFLLIYHHKSYFTFFGSAINIILIISKIVIKKNVGNPREWPSDKGEYWNVW